MQLFRFVVVVYMSHPVLLPSSQKKHILKRDATSYYNEFEQQFV